MSIWISIEHAPKDRPVDLWVDTMRGGYRQADAKWGKYIDFTFHGDTAEHEGWIYWLGHHECWVNIEGSRFARVTHYMLIPEGPTHGQ